MNRRLFSLLLALLLCLAAVAASAETVTLSFMNKKVEKTFTADSEATYVDLGDFVLPDTDEAYAALDAFLLQMPNLTKLDMFSTDIRQNRLEPLAEKFPNIEFGWTMLVPCKNEYRPDRPVHRIRTDCTAFSSLHNRAALPHNEDVWRILKYCKNLQALDIGHNHTIRDLSFLEDLPHLKVLVVSYINVIENVPPLDLTPIGTLKELQYLEVCKDNIQDISPLVNCTSLVDLNLGTNRIRDLTPLMEMKSLRRLYLYNAQSSTGKLNPPDILDQLRAALPDCDVDETVMNSSGKWRNHHRFETISKMFGYSTTSKAIKQEYIPFDNLD